MIRISAEKRPDRALEIAARAKLPVKIAAKIDKVDRVYWDNSEGVPRAKTSPDATK